MYILICVCARAHEHHRTQGMHTRRAEQGRQQWWRMRRRRNHSGNHAKEGGKKQDGGGGHGNAGHDDHDSHDGDDGHCSSADHSLGGGRRLAQALIEEVRDDPGSRARGVPPVGMQVREVALHQPRETLVQQDNGAGWHEGVLQVARRPHQGPHRGQGLRRLVHHPLNQPVQHDRGDVRPEGIRNRELPSCLRVPGTSGPHQGRLGRRRTSQRGIRQEQPGKFPPWASQPGGRQRDVPASTGGGGRIAGSSVAGRGPPLHQGQAHIEERGLHQAIEESLPRLRRSIQQATHAPGTEALQHVQRLHRQQV
ncbi:hypothetical protein H696_03862 [Fonticula alba]|uniref:Uncharacterized protein n=1 Tax=Fonticula alba TaxID=691883 RepID=A0A058Z686_FONAL|nr:hypothetical protein H696_03862 [Fonticula alba]KCV69433.1 hypothetical protein H696_03862 [Fonticula alba]|eukprot:XP_009495998.1 hypothetical protein H696_03862 [Fonticula alba]